MNFTKIVTNLVALYLVVFYLGKARNTDIAHLTSSGYGFPPDLSSSSAPHRCLSFFGITW
jgi:hypothetical protein